MRSLGQPRETTPLVSCLMPTANRRRFVPRAIEYFLRQDFESKELIIVDDGEDAIDDLVPSDERIHYIRLKEKLTLGAKRNLACEQARGDLLAHWDDDDWHAPHRLSYQVEALLREQAEVCGLREMLFYEPAANQTWLYTYPANQRFWLAGGSLLYTRKYWQQAPFPNMQIGEDARFVWSHAPDRAVTLPDYTFYVALIHPGNTSPKDRRGAYWSRWPGDIRSIVGSDFDHFTNPLISQLASTPEPAASSTITPAATVSALVSCILATGNRQAFTRQAIRCFLRQTYYPTELIVVDDGEPPVAELCAGLPSVRYLRLDKPTPLGTKLNIGIQHAQGEIIQKLDDDDYYHPDFLRHLVSRLPAKPRERVLAAADCFLVLLAGERQVRFSGHGWSAGGTLCFHRAMWERAPFRDLPREVDAWFIRDHQPRLVRVCEPELYILVRHGRNTWRDMPQGRVDDLFARKPVYPRAIDQLVEPIDHSFYLSLKPEAL